MAKPALAIMSRVPSLEGKSRLSGMLTPEQREALQWAFLEDMLETVKPIDEFKCCVAATPAEHIGKLVAGLGVEVILQPEGSLGQRMLGTMRYLFEQGYAPVILIGSDTPALSAARLQEALALLRCCQVVVGPAVDGGYYLIGMHYPESRVFEGVLWGTGSVLKTTLECCSRNNLSYRLLEPLRDIDRPADLIALAEQFEAQDVASASRTSRLLKYFERMNVL